MDEPFSETAMTIFDEVFRLRWFGELEKGTAKLEAALASDILSPHERERFESLHCLFSRALDPNYYPAEPDHERDIYPLALRAKHCSKEKPHETTKLLWAYAQRCAFGTFDFHRALYILIGYAATYGDWVLAKHMTEILLHHYVVARLMRNIPLLPTGKPSSETQAWTDDPGFPYWEAIKALEVDSAPCWAQMLELTLEMSSTEDQKQYFYPHVVNALRNYYQTVGNFEKQEWLKVYEPV